jgi:hypothetical protein
MKDIVETMEGDNKVWTAQNDRVISIVAALQIEV